MQADIAVCRPILLLTGEGNVHVRLSAEEARDLIQKYLLRRFLRAQTKNDDCCVGEDRIIQGSVRAPPGLDSASFREPVNDLLREGCEEAGFVGCCAGRRLMAGRRGPYFKTMVLPERTDSRAASRISTTIILLASEESPEGFSLPRATAAR
jgi:hypothetical protein